MVSPLATDRHGNALVERVVATAEQLGEAAGHVPCPLALVVMADDEGRVLYGLNAWRKTYELPGGMVEDGESFFAAAQRELEEETSIRVADLTLVGYARFALTDPERDELGAVFSARAPARRPRVSVELLGFVWRSPLSASDLAVSPLDDAIAAWALEKAPAIPHPS